MRKKASRFFGARQSEDYSRPSSSASSYNPLRFPSSSASSTPRPQHRPKTQPRTLVMSTADIWERREEEELQQQQQQQYAPRLSLDSSIFHDDATYEPEPLFDESFLQSWSEYDEMMPQPYYTRQVSQLQNEVVYYDDQDEDQEPELCDSDYEDSLDEFIDDDFPPQPMFAVSINIMHVGRPKIIDVLPPFSLESFTRPQLRDRHTSISSQTSSNESDSMGSTFSHHSSASSVSDWTKSGHASLPTSPVEKLSRNSSEYAKATGPSIPPRSAKRGSLANLRRGKPAAHDDSDSASENGSSSSSTYNYNDYDWNFLNSEAERTMRRIQAIGTSSS